MKFPVVRYLFVVIAFGIGRARNGLRGSSCRSYSQFVGRGIHLNGVKCTYAYLGGIPSDFPGNINVLDCSNYLEIEADNINRLTDSTFVKYPNLQYLSLKHTGIISIEDDALISLTKLVHLDLSGNAITDLPPLPPSIETLCLNSMLNYSGTFFDSPRTYERMVRLKSSLKTLQMKNNELQLLPTFVRELRRLKSLQVNGNKIKHLTVDDIAPLCSLEELDFTYNNISPFVDRYVCDCVYLKKWVAEERSLKIYNLSCPPFDMTQEQCNEKYGEDLEYRRPEYYKCRTINFLLSYWFYLVCGMTVSTVFCALYYYFQCRIGKSTKRFRREELYNEKKCIDTEEEVSLQEVKN